MSTDVTTEVINPETPIEFGVADEVIAGLKGRLHGLKANTPVEYEAVKAGIAEVRTIRTGVEKARKKLKQSALEWGRKVDTEAKRVTNLLLEIENPLKEEKARIDNEFAERERKREEELAKQREEELRIQREKREAEERAERERQRLELEKQRQQQEEERKKLEEERRQLQLEREKVEAEKRAQQEVERKKREEAERIEREKQEAERQRLEAERKEAERKEAERIRLERRPDADVLRDFATLLPAIECPSMKTEWGQQIVDETVGELDRLKDAILDQLKGMGA